MKENSIASKIEKIFEVMSKELIEIQVLHTKRLEVNRIYHLTELKKFLNESNFKLLESLGIWDVAIHYHIPSSEYHVIYLNISLETEYVSRSYFYAEY